MTWERFGRKQLCLWNVNSIVLFSVFCPVLCCAVLFCGEWFTFVSLVIKKMQQTWKTVKLKIKSDIMCGV
jgi:hypothetical protein